MVISSSHGWGVMCGNLHSSWQALRKYVDPIICLYLTTGTAIVLVFLYLIAVPPIVIAGISLFGGFFIGVMSITWKLNDILQVNSVVPVAESEPTVEPAIIKAHVKIPEVPSAQQEATPYPKPEPGEIPVEDLANGIINALGDGLGAVIEKGVLPVGGGLASRLTSGADTTVATARMSLSRLYNFAYRQASKGEKVHKG